MKKTGRISHIASHPLQSPAWGEFRKRMGIDVVRISGVGQLTFHRIPFTPWTIGYFPKGSLPSIHMIEELKKTGRQKKAIFIQLEPDVIENFKLKIRNYGLQPSHHPLFTKYTFVIDLAKSEDELLKAMHHKTRYNIKVAQKHGVAIKEDNSPEAFETYLTLSRETTQRQGFFAHNEIYHRTMWETMHKADIAHLFTATYQKTILVAWVVFVWNDTVYYPYGTSSRLYRETMAPTLMLWEITRWAKKKGLKYFDLWGALGPDPDPKDPWFGFHRFKQGFSPTLVEYVGSYDLVLQPLLYRLYCIADGVRWFFLKIVPR